MNQTIDGLYVASMLGMMAGILISLVVSIIAIRAKIAAENGRDVSITHVLFLIKFILRNDLSHLAMLVSCDLVFALNDSYPYLICAMIVAAITFANINIRAFGWIEHYCVNTLYLCTAWVVRGYQPFDPMSESEAVMQYVAAIFNGIATYIGIVIVDATIGWCSKQVIESLRRRVIPPAIEPVVQH